MSSNATSVTCRSTQAVGGAHAVQLRVNAWQCTASHDAAAAAAVVSALSYPQPVTGEVWRSITAMAGDVTKCVAVSDANAVTDSAIMAVPSAVVHVPAVVTSVWPPAGSVEGGQRVLLRGSGFSSLSQHLSVTVGGKPCRLLWSSVHALLCQAPAERSSHSITTWHLQDDTLMSRQVYFNNIILLETNSITSAVRDTTDSSTELIRSVPGTSHYQKYVRMDTNSWHSATHNAVTCNDVYAPLHGSITTGGELHWSEYTFHGRLHSGGTYRIGLFVLYQDEQNFVRYVLDYHRNCRTLVVMANGTPTVVSFESDRSVFQRYKWFQLTLSVVGGRVRAWRDTDLLLDVALPSDAPASGKVGFMSERNHYSIFHEAHVVFGDAGDGVWGASNNTTTTAGPGLGWAAANGAQPLVVTVRGASAVPVPQTVYVPTTSSSAVHLSTNGVDFSQARTWLWCS